MILPIVRAIIIHATKRKEKTLTETSVEGSGLVTIIDVYSIDGVTPNNETHKTQKQRYQFEFGILKDWFSCSASIR